MKLIIFITTMVLLSSLAFSNENSTVQTDMKFLCEINKMEKVLRKDKSVDKADLAMRIHAIKEAAFQDKASKEALRAIAVGDPSEQSRNWKRFAQENGVKKVNCL